MSGCIGEPVSWLRLERCRLGELPEVERSAIEQHVTACPVCAECWRAVSEPIALPALPLMAARKVTRLRPHKRAFAWSGWLGFASAAAVALALWHGGTSHEGARLGRALRAKGGEFALELVRVDAQARQQEATHFAPGDRFKVLVTYPPDWHGQVEVVAYQDARAYFPLDSELIEQGGNRRSLPGAFQLDGTSAADVCVVLSEAPVDRRALALGIEHLPTPSLCARLEPNH